MSHRPFRFVHASDFHLEMPLQGVAEVPDHLREALLDAAYTAAERVFDAVLAEEAEFLVLSGDILHPPQTGPRGPLFLSEQFARLAQRQIPVYWASGGVDPPEAWPAVIPLARQCASDVPRPGCRTGSSARRRAVGPAAAGRPRRQSHDAARAIFTPTRPGCIRRRSAWNGRNGGPGTPGIDYWALGGRHDRSTLFSAPQVAHYAGSPQGRRPDEAGVHGCTLVQVDENRQSRTILVPTDAIRWLSERVVVEVTTSRSELESLLRQRMQTLLETTPKLGLMVSWTSPATGR